MFHGRFTPRWTARLATALIAALAPAAPAQDAPLKLSWEAADHPSGIYHVKSPATLSVIVDNPSDRPQELTGEILFGPATADVPFRALSVTPLTPAVLAPRQRAKIPIQLTFAGAGSYELRFKHDLQTRIEHEGGLTLQCIFAPRIPPPARADESPWLTPLPRSAARIPGYLRDFSEQTTIRRFLIDERFAFDAATNIGLGFGASTGADVRAVDALLTEASAAKTSLILRVQVPIEPPNERMLAAFSQYITDAARRSKGTLKAIAVVPAAHDAAPRDAETLRASMRAYYLAAHAVAKRADKNIIMLGTGSAQSSAAILENTPNAAGYLDALAITNASTEPLLARPLFRERLLPLFILPPLDPAIAPAPPAAGLAQTAVVVTLPLPEIDHGVTAHLLGGTTLLQRLRLAAPPGIDPPEVPFIGIFQGEGYAVATIAGFSAGTDIDAQFPTLARTRSQVEPAQPDERPPYPSLEVSDDTRSMRVVDDQGAPVDCRVGDTLYIPASDKIVYLLQASAAEDLAGSLRPSHTHRLPLVEITRAEPQTLTEGPTLTLNLRNITSREITGRLRLIHTPPNEAPATILTERDLAPLPAGKSAPLTLTLKEPLPEGGALVAEITTTGARAVIQRTVVAP